MNVNWLDAAILLAFFWLGFTGLTAGVVRSGLTTLSFALGVILAGLFYQRLANDLSVMINDPTTDRLVALLAIFVATAFAGQILAVVLKQAASILFFGPLDGFGGLLLGLIKAFIVVEVVLIIFVTYKVGFMTDAVNHSALASYFLKDFPFIDRLLPSDFRHAVQQFAQQGFS